MRSKITNRTITTVKAKDKPYEIRDTDLKGFLLRVQPSGSMTYYVELDRGRRIKIGASPDTTPAQAREIAESHKGQYVRHKNNLGEDPIAMKKRTKADTYLQFVTGTYKQYLILNLVHGENACDTLVKGFCEFHNLPLSDITPGTIEKWRTRRLEEGINPNTINRQLSDLKAMLNRARDKYDIPISDKLDRVKPCKIDRSPKVRFLSVDEERKLRESLDEREHSIRAGRQRGNEWRAERNYALANDLSDRTFVDHLKPAVLLSLNTGLRRGELLKLKWENVNFDLRTITVIGATSKTGKTRHIPMNDEALSALKRWKEQPGIKSPFVFTGLDGQPLHDMRTSWENLLKAAQIQEFRWHDLRHTFASKLVMAGVDLNTVRELLGHTDYKMTLRYAHLAPEHKAAAVNKLVAQVVSQ